MDEIPRQKLLEVVRRFGRNICEDAHRCEALLLDVCRNQYPKEVFGLVSAVKHRVASELAAGLSNAPREVLLARLTKRLHSLGLAEDLARWSVESWGLALKPLQIEEVALPFTCPACRQAAKVASELSDKRIQCPNCKMGVQISQDGRRFEPLGERTDSRGHMGGAGIPIAKKRPTRSADGSWACPCPRCGFSDAWVQFRCARCGWPCSDTRVSQKPDYSNPWWIRRKLDEYSG